MTGRLAHCQPEHGELGKCVVVIQMTVCCCLREMFLDCYCPSLMNGPKLLERRTAKSTDSVDIYSLSN
jgi:hypothetical protein